MCNVGSVSKLRLKLLLGAKETRPADQRHKKKHLLYQSLGTSRQSSLLVSWSFRASHATIPELHPVLKTDLAMASCDRKRAIPRTRTAAQRVSTTVAGTLHMRLLTASASLAPIENALAMVVDCDHSSTGRICTKTGLIFVYTLGWSGDRLYVSQSSPIVSLAVNTVKRNEHGTRFFKLTTDVQRSLLLLAAI